MQTQALSRSKLFTARHFFAELDHELESDLLDSDIMSAEPDDSDIAPYARLAACQD